MNQEKNPEKVTLFISQLKPFTNYRNKWKKITIEFLITWYLGK